MKIGETFWEVTRFELGYQARRPWTWLYLAAMFALSHRIATDAYFENARSGGYYFNSPYVTMSVTLAASIIGLLAVAAFAGDAGARDVQVRMHPLLYSSPVREGTYLRGRFLAALLLGALTLLTAPAALLLALVFPGAPPDVLGPFRAGPYVTTYLVVALPNIFVATALAFSMAALSRRAIAGYLGGVVLFFSSILVLRVFAEILGRWDLATLLDPLGVAALTELTGSTTPAAKNALDLTRVAPLMWNRGLWIGVAFVALIVTHLRFRFDAAPARPKRARRSATPSDRAPAVARVRDVVVPRAARAFGRATRLSQTVVIALQSFRAIALSWGGLVLCVLAIILVVLGPQAMNHMGVPLLPTTRQMTGFVGNTGEILWTIVPLLTAFYVGELVWRERETGLSEIADAAPVPEWARLVGRYVGLALVLVAYQALLLVASVIVQARLGYYDFQLGLYARIFFGLQLADHLLFAALALTVQVVVNQKYVGYLVVLAAYAFTVLAGSLGIEHHLVVFGSSPDWSYSDLRGFGTSVVPWMWFKVYWGAWSVLLAVAARLLWVRGREHGLAARLRVIRQRFTATTAGAAVAALGLIITLGGFIFYNTNVLNAYTPTSRSDHRRMEYERHYRRYAAAPQPMLAGTTLRVELYPERNAVEISGTDRLVNRTGVAIDSIHVAPAWDVETGPIELDRPAAQVLADDTLGHRIYALQSPLLPGDSVALRFSVRLNPRGFTNAGIDPSVVPNGTYLEANDVLPRVGYQSGREIVGVGDRLAYGLAPRPAVRRLEDSAARNDGRGAARIAFEATIGTSASEIAVAPGALRRTWMEHGRRYFQYVTDAPIRNDVAFTSAAYAVREGRWKDVTIQVYHHPAHTANADRMVRSAQASLEYLTAQFGPYPHHQLRLVERPSPGNSLHAAPVNVSYEEGFSLFDPDHDARRIDLPFAVVAHEVAHSWWGNQLSPAPVEGSALLTESLAWYSALSVVEVTSGDAELQRLLGMMREAYITPRSRGGLPLLRARDWFHAYRKGPFAMYALREYIGAEQVNTALRTMLRRYGSGTPPLPTSLDLYAELQAVTPDSLRYLLTDLFATNTWWDLATTRATAEPTTDGQWRVSLDVRARKVVADTIGVEVEAPMNDLVEVGVFADSGAGAAPVYRGMHRIRSGERRITVVVPRRPVRAGIDPRSLLIDVNAQDNHAAVVGAAQRE